MIKTKVTPVKKVEVKIIKTVEVYPKYEDPDSGIVVNSIEELKINLEDCVDLNVTLSKNNLTNISFSSEELPHCCGIHEIGNLSADRDFPVKELTKILDRLVESKPNQRTTLINTNGKSSSIVFELALAKCKYWTLVKTTPNPGTSSIIKMWISNN